MRLWEERPAKKQAPGLKLLRRIAVAVVGGAVLLFGIVMIVLPGPAILVIPLGLGILALEFAWARVWLAKFRTLFSRKKKDGKPPDLPPKA